MGKQLACDEGDAQRPGYKPVRVFCDQEGGWGGSAQSLEEVVEGDNEDAIPEAGLGYRVHRAFCSSQGRFSPLGEGSN